ncbi:CBS domain protein [Musa troglodytarum]|uniref:CBS domain protein n=1 Tax=Musa troglodytarum TaxID=320322 RepID=A0A9E7JA44_9LILI|nr:CBS domain protein [Musa troglodytarum]
MTGRRLHSEGFLCVPRRRRRLYLPHTIDPSISLGETAFLLESADGSWLWCTTDDTVYDAVKSMTQHNVGALVVVKPGEEKAIAGIVTERGSH